MAKKQIKMAQNQFEAIGTVHSVDLTVKKNTNPQKKYTNCIYGTIKVLVKEVDDEGVETINLHNFKVVSTDSEKSLKSYKALETIKNTYKSIKDVEAGEAEVADRVKVTGSLKLNEWNKDGKVITNNEFDARFFNRLEPGDTREDKFELVIKCLINKVSEDVDDEGNTKVKVKALSVGYKENIIEPQSLVVLDPELVEAFTQEIIEDETTLKLVVDVKRGLVITSKETSGGGRSWGKKSTITGEKYVQVLEIVGADLIENGYDEEEVSHIKKLRKMQKATIKGDIEEGQPPVKEDKPAKTWGKKASKVEEPEDDEDFDDDDEAF